MQGVALVVQFPPSLLLTRITSKDSLVFGGRHLVADIACAMDDLKSDSNDKAWRTCENK